ncbi:hypothetical protein MCAP1_000269 [Malassezia caprae]|uniref:Uncharacterized protein n=1 Tax=Malassezia caprae TaxID=1381934 RepID=A0AAF0E248_9BASI|nr:hypothetical protein MCAP1_000269 [Malassezia caprae]
MSAENKNPVPNQKEIEKLAKESGEQAEHLLDEAKAAAHKVGDFVSKEAHELEEHAKQAGKSLSKNFETGFGKAKQILKDFSSNPKYWLSTLSVVNAALIGAAGYFGYQNRNEIKTWDRRLLAAIAAGVVTFFGAESALVTKQAKKQLK